MAMKKLMVSMPTGDKEFFEGINLIFHVYKDEGLEIREEGLKEPKQIAWFINWNYVREMGE